METFLGKFKKRGKGHKKFRRTVQAPCGGIVQCLTSERLKGLFLLRLLLRGKFHDKAVQCFGQALAVVIALLGRNIDGLQG